MKFSFNSIIGNIPPTDVEIDRYEKGMKIIFNKSCSGLSGIVTESYANDHILPVGNGRLEVDGNIEYLTMRFIRSSYIKNSDDWIVETYWNFWKQKTKLSDGETQTL